ncbi:hypothetical protein I7I53_06863 [Histoplasma capsulatum var. duboisii H88]|uniref:Uncharacterized protein n=1 Tax=Ajellomyces capsulatus (strain H88) TaxID=544711 RepID=A0A8A1LAS2_AJEC8|nr:hypothetical protein I7I53_06863 [Histoplasma capsulatum var. duboisii H88]
MSYFFIFRNSIQVHPSIHPLRAAGTRTVHSLSQFNGDLSFVADVVFSFLASQSQCNWARSMDDRGYMF